MKGTPSSGRSSHRRQSRGAIGSLGARRWFLSFQGGEALLSLPCFSADGRVAREPGLGQVEMAGARDGRQDDTSYSHSIHETGEERDDGSIVGE